MSSSHYPLPRDEIDKDVLAEMCRQVARMQQIVAEMSESLDRRFGKVSSHAPESVLVHADSIDQPIHDHVAFTPDSLPGMITDSESLALISDSTDVSKVSTVVAPSLGVMQFSKDSPVEAAIVADPVANANQAIKDEPIVDLVLEYVDEPQAKDNIAFRSRFCFNSILCDSHYKFSSVAIASMVSSASTRLFPPPKPPDFHHNDIAHPPRPPEPPDHLYMRFYPTSQSILKIDHQFLTTVFPNSNREARVSTNFFPIPVHVFHPVIIIFSVGVIFGYEICASIAYTTMEYGARGVFVTRPLRTYFSCYTLRSLLFGMPIHAFFIHADFDTSGPLGLVMFLLYSKLDVIAFDFLHYCGLGVKLNFFDFVETLSSHGRPSVQQVFSSCDASSTFEESCGGYGCFCHQLYISNFGRAVSLGVFDLAVCLQPANFNFLQAKYLLKSVIATVHMTCHNLYILLHPKQNGASPMGQFGAMKSLHKIVFHPWFEAHVMPSQRQMHSSFFVGNLIFKEMCVVSRKTKGWRKVTVLGSRVKLLTNANTTIQIIVIVSCVEFSHIFYNLEDNVGLHGLDGDISRSVWFQYLLARMMFHNEGKFHSEYSSNEGLVHDILNSKKHMLAAYLFGGNTLFNSVICLYGKGKLSMGVVNASIMRGCYLLILATEEANAFNCEFSIFQLAEFIPWDPGGHFQRSKILWSFQSEQWDPGKFFHRENFYNLEDKVGFDGIGIDTFINGGGANITDDNGPAIEPDAATTMPRPQRAKKPPSRFLSFYSIERYFPFTLFAIL